ncbi:hypothetical protein C8R44DRAFT_807357 [Mycena epipterygia]|nr:hypothetical protein C8R44DRAFT_807357 [Mycena epipterygia]
MSKDRQLLWLRPREFKCNRSLRNEIMEKARSLAVRICGEFACGTSAKRTTPVGLGSEPYELVHGFFFSPLDASCYSTQKFLYNHGGDFDHN